MIFQPLGFSNGGFINYTIVFHGAWNSRVWILPPSHFLDIVLKPICSDHVMNQSGF